LGWDPYFEFGRVGADEADEVRNKDEVIESVLVGLLGIHLGFKGNTASMLKSQPSAGSGWLAG